MLEDLEDLGQRFNFEVSMLEHRFNFKASRGPIPRGVVFGPV